MRKTLAEKGVGRKEGFRWRGSEITRLEGFTDAVFAFAITLLVVSLEVPRTFTELLDSMQGFVAFALGFALLFFIWYNQYLFFRRYGLQDVFTITLNAVLLFVVLFFVYPLKFLCTLVVRQLAGQGLLVRLANGAVEPAIHSEQSSLLMVIYSLGYVAIFAIFALLFIHAYRRRTDLGLSAIEVCDTRASIQSHLMNVLVGLVSITIVLVGGQGYVSLSGFIYFLLGPALTLNGMIMGKRRERIAHHTV